jgi:hypothetical protein
MPQARAKCFEWHPQRAESLFFKSKVPGAAKNVRVHDAAAKLFGFPFFKFQKHGLHLLPMSLAIGYPFQEQRDIGI